MGKRAQRMYGSYKTEDITVGDKVMRRCSCCGEVKPLQEFPRSGKTKDGLVNYRTECKVCYNIKRRENKTRTRHASFVSGMKRRGEDNVEYNHQQWKETVIFFGGECAYCGRTMKKGERLTRDHLEPISRGGKTVQSNVVPACTSCNCSKGNTEWHEWFMKQPFFSQERMNRIFKWRSIMRAAGEE